MNISRVQPCMHITNGKYYFVADMHKKRLLIRADRQNQSFDSFAYPRFSSAQNCTSNRAPPSSSPTAIAIVLHAGQLNLAWYDNKLEITSSIVNPHRRIQWGRPAAGDKLRVLV